MIRRTADGQEELVLIDWPFPGPDAVGVELQNFVATNAFWFEAEPSRADEFERAVYPAYLKGLEHGGWDGDRRQVRLGYTAGMVLWKGATLAGWPILLLDKQPALVFQMFGRSTEEVISGWIALHDFVFERVDEASALIRKGVQNGLCRAFGGVGACPGRECSSIIIHGDRMRDDLAVEVKRDHLLMQRGRAEVVVFPGELWHPGLAVPVLIVLVATVRSFVRFRRLRSA